MLIQLNWMYSAAYLTTCQAMSSIRGSPSNLFGINTYTKPPECVNIIRHTS